MKTRTLLFSHNDGWSDRHFPEDDSPRTLITVFGSSDFLDHQDAFRDLVSRYPTSKIIGCSTAGEILGSTVHDDTLVAAITKFERTGLELATVANISPGDSFDAGRAIAGQLNKDDLKGVLVLSDGLKVNGTKLVAGINSELPGSVIATGGLAGDGARFARTWVTRDGLPETGCVTAVGFYGNSVRINHGSKGGWDIFGPERMVTRSCDNELFELDGKPALELYKLYLGDRSDELPASALLFPLSLRNGSDQKRIVRTVLGVNESTNSMVFAGDLTEGSYVQLMRANLDRLIHGASEAALMTAAGSKQSVVLSIAISCVGRRLILGERTEEELEAVLESLPASTKQVGFYSYGEISPYISGHCDLHNQTMTLTTISED
jgi:hypothetical protein